MTKTTKGTRRRGRPKLGAKALAEPVMIRFPKPMLAAIDEIAVKRLDRPGRSSLVRELVGEALAARAKRGKR